MVISVTVLSEDSNVGISNASSVLNIYKKMLKKATRFKGHKTVLNNKIDENMLNILESRIDQLTHHYSIQYLWNGKKPQVPTKTKVMRNQVFYRKDIWNEENKNLLKVTENDLKFSPKWAKHPENHTIKGKNENKR